MLSLAKTVKSKLAPLKIKNNINIGGVISSILLNVRIESFLKLIKIAPVTMHIKRLDKSKFPMKSCLKRIDKPKFKNKAKIHSPILLARDLNKLNNNEIKNPKTAPIAKDKTISITGLASISYRFITPFPVSIVLAILNKTENKIKATASSRATTGSKVSVTGPLALYCLITNNVAAGAVAQLIAARVRIRGHDI